jgi:predicted PurR-regulated permease PerM
MSTLSEQTSRRVFVGLVLLAIALVALVVRPFGTALFLAAVLAGALAPLQAWLKRRLRGRANPAAGVLVTSVLLLVLAPLGGLVAFSVKETVAGYQFVSETLRSQGMEGLVSALPDSIEEPARRLLAKFSVGVDELGQAISEKASEEGGTAARAVTGVVATTGTVVFQTVMMLIALFFMLVEGRQLVDWMERVVPLKPGQTRELLIEFRKVSVSVLLSSLVTAAVQALAAFVGYLIARVPHALFFGAVTFVMALIPAVGAGAVCLVAALLLLALGHPWAALFLAVWGLVVVGLVDNIVKPLLVKRGISMHGAVVFFALLGGLSAFGPSGLLLGPLIISLLLSLVRIYERDYKTKPPPRAPDEPATPVA